RVVDSLVEHVDLAPTILDYAGLPQPAELPGISLRPMLEPVLEPAAAGAETQPAAKEAVLCEYVTNDRSRRSLCLRTARYKYVFAGAGAPVELYDLQEDPQELVNVAADAAYRDEVARHAALLLDRLLRTQQTPWNRGGSTVAGIAVDPFGRTVDRPSTASG
ncbi:MAG: sulfatase/phosphatase domain-containing protein, partial [Chloroflexota bacterium]